MTKLYDELQQRSLWTLFDRLEAPLSVILALLELRGLRVNDDVMLRSRDTLQVMETDSREYFLSFLRSFSTTVVLLLSLTIVCRIRRNTAKLYYPFCPPS